MVQGCQKSREAVGFAGSGDDVDDVPGVHVQA